MPDNVAAYIPPRGTADVVGRGVIALDGNRIARLIRGDHVTHTCRLVTPRASGSSEEAAEVQVEVQLLDSRVALPSIVFGKCVSRKLHAYALSAHGQDIHFLLIQLLTIRRACQLAVCISSVPMGG